MLSKPGSIFSILAVLILGYSCKNKEANSPSYGLKKLEIYLSQDALKVMNSSVYTKTPVPGKIELNGNLKKVRVNFAGATTINHRKRNFDVISQSPIDIAGHDIFRVRLSATTTEPTGVKPIIANQYFEELGVLAPYMEQSAVYINDQYAGLYKIIEYVDEDFFIRRGLNVASLYKARNISASMDEQNLRELRKGFSSRLDPKNYQDLSSLIRSCLISVTDCQDSVNAKTFAAYLTASIKVNNSDGIVNNFILYRLVGESRFQIVIWDLDKILPKNPNYSNGFINRNKVFYTLMQAESFRSTMQSNWKKIHTTDFRSTLSGMLQTETTKITPAWKEDPYFPSVIDDFNDEISAIEQTILADQTDIIWDF